MPSLLAFLVRFGVDGDGLYHVHTIDESTLWSREGEKRWTFWCLCADSAARDADDVAPCEHRRRRARKGHSWWRTARRAGEEVHRVLHGKTTPTGAAVNVLVKGRRWKDTKRQTTHHHHHRTKRTE